MQMSLPGGTTNFHTRIPTQRVISFQCRACLPSFARKPNATETFLIPCSRSFQQAYLDTHSIHTNTYLLSSALVNNYYRWKLPGVPTD